MLRVEEVDRPEPGPDQVLIEVISAGINFSDIQAIAGYYATAPEPPWTPGHEVAGIDCATGDPVMAYVPSGGYAEFVVAERAFTFPAPGLALEDAGGFPLVCIAALISLTDAARVRAGDTILITAAAGGFGCAAVQVARYLGAERIVGLVSTAEKRAFALGNGADEVISYDDPLPAADVLLETVGAADGAFSDRLDAVRALGRVMILGASSGEAAVLPGDAWLKDRNITGVVFSWGALRRNAPEVARKKAANAAELVLEGTLRPPVELAVSLDDVAAAHRAILRRRTMGKVVMRPAL